VSPGSLRGLPSLRASSLRGKTGSMLAKLHVDEVKLGEITLFGFLSLPNPM